MCNAYKLVSQYWITFYSTYCICIILNNYVIVRYAVAITSDRVQHSPNLGEPGFGLPPDVPEDVHGLRLWLHETDWNHRVSVHLFKYMGNPAH